MCEAHGALIFQSPSRGRNPRVSEREREREGEREWERERERESEGLAEDFAEIWMFIKESGEREKRGRGRSRLGIEVFANVRVHNWSMQRDEGGCRNSLLWVGVSAVTKNMSSMYEWWARRRGIFFPLAKRRSYFIFWYAGFRMLCG